MIIRLPNGEERKLDKELPIEEKIEICEKLIEEFDDDIVEYFNQHKISYFLNGLAGFICWHKDDERTDKENGILSNSREKQMDRKRYHGRYRKDIPFTDLNGADEIKIFGEMENDEE